MPDPENRFHQFCSLRAHESPDSQNLTLVQLERNVFERPGICGSQISYFKACFADFGFYRRETVRQIPAYHKRDELVAVHFCYRISSNDFTVAHNRNFIGNFKDLFHFMGDIYYCHPFGPQIPDNVKKVGDFIFC